MDGGVVMRDNFGDRMKAYEAAETERRFMPMLPIYARLDGRCFSRFTKGMERPFDAAFHGAMVRVVSKLVDETHARIGYTQSDEISLVWLVDDPKSEPLFGGKVHKITSVLAGLGSSSLCRIAMADAYLRTFAERAAPHFDCRAFQLPSKMEAANAILWREQDATKNAISMAARALYSHKALHGKSGTEMQEMMFSKGQNFNDYPPSFKRGTFVRRVLIERSFTAAELARIPEKHRPAPGALVQRHTVEAIDMPKFSSVKNRVEVIFDGAPPLQQADMENP